MKGKKFFVSVITLFLLILVVGLSQAQGPGPDPLEETRGPEDTEAVAGVSRIVPIQGKLTDAAGVPITGTRTITFTLYTSSGGDTFVCRDSDPVAMDDNGLFNAQMHYCNADDIDGRQLYLGIQAEGDPEMTPRQPIYPVPYAFSLAPGALISDTRDGILTVRSTGAGDSDALIAQADGTGEAVEGYSVGGLGVWAHSDTYVAMQGYSYDNTSVPAIFGCSADAGSSCDPHRDDAAAGVMGASYSTDGYGGYFVNPSGSSTDRGVGVLGLSGSGSIDDIHPGGSYYPAGGEFAGPNGIIGATSPDATGGYGVIGFASGTSGRAVYGHAITTTGATYGGYFETESTSGRGVYALADANSGTTYAGYFDNDSTSGYAIYARADAESGTNYGVYSRSDSPDGYAGYFYNGDAGGVAVMAAGTGIIQSTADTEMAVSPMKLMLDPDNSNNPQLRPDGNGIVDLRPTATGTAYAYLPVDLPAHVFGVDQKLESIRVCYDLDNAASYIDETSVHYTNDSGARVDLVTDSINRTSTAWNCYTVTDATPGTFAGSLFVRFRFYFGGTGGAYEVHIGNITLTLTEN